MPNRRAEIYIEDAEDGNVETMFRFMGGPFDPGSKAHQLCNIIRKYCETIMTVEQDKPQIEVSGH